MPKIIKNIQAINAVDIPYQLCDSCLDIDNEFPLHYSNGIVGIDKEEHKDHPFVIWLIEQGFEFPDNGYEWLGVWGT